MSLSPRLLRTALLFLLLASVVSTIAVRWDPATARAEGFHGTLDLGHGVSVERFDFTDPELHFVVAKAPRRKGAKLRCVLATGREPLGRLAKRVDALAAVNGDFHEMPREGHPYLVGKTYSSLVEGGDPDDLARYRVLVSARAESEASFWLDTARVPHVDKVELGVSLGLAVAARQGLDDRRAQIRLVPDPLPGKHRLEGGEVAFPVERAGDAWRVRGPAAGTLEGPALVVEKDAVALVTTAVVPGTLVRVTVQKRVDLAIGTGPWLLRSGEIPGWVEKGNEAWSHYARTAVGLSADTVFLVASIHQAHNAASMVDLARALRQLGCTDAVNLDGGPSTGLWAQGRLFSDSEDFQDFTDPVGSALCLCPGTEGVDDVR